MENIDGGPEETLGKGTVLKGKKEHAVKKSGEKQHRGLAMDAGTGKNKSGSTRIVVRKMD